MRPVPSRCATAALLIALAAALPAQAQQDWLSKAIPADARSHDFGSVVRAANTEHRFVIKNTLDSEMHIRSVRASCGCTTPIIETKTIPPGGSGTILARFNTGTFTGHKSATLTVSIDRPVFTEIQLSVKGYIRSDIVVSPGEANFGEVLENKTKKLQLSLDYAGRNDWKILRITSPLDYVSVDFKEVSRSGGRIKYEITAELAGEAPIGRLHDQLILHTNDRRITSVPLRLLADIQPTIRLSPSALTLGALTQGEAVPQRLVIKAPEAFKILSITSEIADIEYTPSEDSKTAHLVSIKVRPNQTGKFDGTLLLKTDLSDELTKVSLSYETTQSQISGSVPRIAVPVSKQ